MFKKEDFNHIDKMNNEMADGIVDATDSQIILEEIVNVFATTDYLSDDSRMELMMRCINLCYEIEDGEDLISEDKMFSVITAICFNYCNVMSNLAEEGFDIPKYFDFIKNELLPIMREDSKSLPYWDMDEN